MTLATLYGEGKVPHWRDKFTMHVIEGNSSLIQSFSSHVGIQSRAHDDEGDFIIILRMLSSVNSVNWLKTEVGGDGGETGGVVQGGKLSSLSFTFSIFSTKKRAKSFASSSGSSCDGRALVVVEEHSLSTARRSWRGSLSASSDRWKFDLVVIRCSYIPYIELDRCRCELARLISDIISYTDISRVLHSELRHCTCS